MPQASRPRLKRPGRKALPPRFPAGPLHVSALMPQKARLLPAKHAASPGRRFRQARNRVMTAGFKARAAGAARQPGKGPATPLAKRPENGYVDSLSFLQSNSMNAMSTQPALTGRPCTNQHAADRHATARFCGLRAHLAATELFNRTRRPVRLPEKAQAGFHHAHIWIGGEYRIMSPGEGRPVHQEQGCPSHVFSGADAPCGHEGKANIRSAAARALPRIFTPQHPSGRHFS